MLARPLNLQNSKFTTMRNLLTQSKLTRVVGCGDAIGGILASKAGFDAVWASGLSISTTMGLPDAGILTMTELLAMAVVINRSTSLPVIADCDTGFGDVDNVVHMVREYESAGIAAVCIEDKCFPKTNSFIGQQSLAPIAIAAGRIKAAKSAASKDGILIIARVESFIADTGLSDAIKRSIAYAQSGADALLIHSKASTPDEIFSFCKLWKKVGTAMPIIVVPTTYYSVSSPNLHAAGISAVIYANHALRASVKAVEETFNSINSANSTAQVEKNISSVSEILTLIGMEQLKRHDNQEQHDLLSASKKRQYVLLNPGPVNVHESVKGALVGPDICHREPDFFELLCSSRDKIVNVCAGGSDHAAVILTGSGTAALESTVISIVPEGGKILVLDNGRYGERIARIATSHHIAIEHLKFGWAQPFDLEKIQNVLESDPTITTIGIAHHETSTGMLNPLNDVGQLAKKYNKEVVVDAISSLGGEPFNIVDDNVTWCVGSSNKCIEGTPGLGFVCASHKAFQSLASRPPKGFYLDLGENYVSQYEKKAPLFTPSVQTFYAFERALQLLIAEGVENRNIRYSRHARRMREGLKELGFDFLITEQHMSCVVTIVYLPEGITYPQLHDILKTKGFIIYTGQDDPNPVFRVATIGQLEDSDIEAFLFSLEESLEALKGESPDTDVRDAIYGT